MYKASKHFLVKGVFAAEGDVVKPKSEKVANYLEKKGFIRRAKPEGKPKAEGDVVKPKSEKVAEPERKV